MQNKAKYLNEQMNVTAFIAKGYGNKSRLRPPKKQSQTNPNKAKFKKAKMNVTSILTVGYENISPFRAPKKQTQISKRQKTMQPSLPQRIMKKTAISGSGKTNPIQSQSKPIKARLEELERLSLSQAEIDTIVNEGMQFLAGLELILHNSLSHEKLTVLRQCVEKTGINKPAGKITLAIRTVPVGNLLATQEIRFSV